MYVNFIIFKRFTILIGTAGIGLKKCGLNNFLKLIKFSYDSEKTSGQNFHNFILNNHVSAVYFL